MPNLDELESQRLQLEEKVAKLRKSLQHWRTWDAEYEGLKEELSTSADINTKQDCVCFSEFGTFNSELNPNRLELANNLMAS